MKVLNPRESGKYISSLSQHVQIRDNGVKECAKVIVNEIRKNERELSASKLFHQNPVHPTSKDEAGLDWILFASTINFSFWKHESEPQYRGTTYTGYIACCAAITRTLDQSVPLTDPKFYGNMSKEELNQFLMGDNGIPIPMLEERHHCLKEVASVLRDKYDGSAWRLLQKADKSAQKLLTLVTQDFPCFRDEASLDDGTRVAIYKRAQIFIADLHSLFEGQGLAEFKDIDTLTMFGDYRVPQSLQYFAVFSYSPELLQALRRNELLPTGSKFEVEIRGCSIRAVELIVADIKRQDPTLKVNDILVDYFLWCFRREKAQEMEQYPYHKTRSVYY